MPFGRKKRDGDAADDAVTAAGTRESTSAEPAVTTGPFDVADAPDDADTGLDLGALRLPMRPDIEVRVEVSAEGDVVAATAVHRGSQLQLNAFAAPRSAGIWADVRAEIADSLRQQGGGGEEVEGPFGTELRARVPGSQPGMTVPARFLGVDGPRWFLRGLITGPAATDAAQATPLLDLFRDVVVVRGKDAMAPRDALPLQLPREARDAARGPDEAGDDVGGEGGEDGAPDLNPFRRGPEITETR